MNRSSDKLKKRRAFVKDFFDNYDGFLKDAAKDLSERLFLSESTIWNDYYSVLETENKKE